MKTFTAVKIRDSRPESMVEGSLESIALELLKKGAYEQARAVTELTGTIKTFRLLQLKHSTEEATANKDCTCPEQVNGWFIIEA